MSEVIILNDTEFEEKVLKSQGVFMVDFWAPWCGPCRAVSPVIEEIAREKFNIKVGKLNTDENPLMTSKYGIMSIPTILIFKNGQLVYTLHGVQSKEEIESQIEKAIYG